MRIGSDLRHSLRKLARTPVFTITAALTLAIGIGANTAIFSVVDGVLLRPLPYPDSERLVGLWHTAPGIGVPEMEQSNSTYTLYRENTSSFSEIAIVNRGLGLNLTGAGEPEMVLGAGATASMFRVLGVGPAIGRAFAEDEDDPGAPGVVILSDALWERNFGGDRSVLGQAIQLDGEPYEIIGVMAPGFHYPREGTDLWVPHVILPEELGQANFSYLGIGRLAEGTTHEMATAELNQWIPRLPIDYPGEISPGMWESAGVSAYVTPLKADVVGDVGRVLWILLGTVAFVLLIATANVANLFLVRAEGRRKELAVRTAMGATRQDIVRAYLTESVVLSAVGAIAGIALALVGVRALVAMGPENLPRLGEIGIRGSVLLFTGAISLLSGLLFGAIPAIKYGTPNLATALKEGGRGGSAGKESHRANHALVAAQVALALMLLVGSGLMARSFMALRSVDPGFDGENVLTMTLSLPEAEFPDEDGVAVFYQQLIDRAEGLPGVSRAGLVSNLPMVSGQNNTVMIVEDIPLAPDQVPPIIRTNVASPGYFESMSIRLVEGRTFERSDHETRRGVAIVSRSAAERFWPDESAIGKRVTPTLPTAEDFAWLEVVGVVEDVRDDGLAQDAPAMVYYAMLGPSENRFVPRNMDLAIRTTGNPAALTRAVTAEVWALNPRLPVARVRTTADITRESASRTTFTMIMLGIAAAVALLLGTVGVYGVISYVVSQRTREFGIRQALGAEQRDIRGMVVRQGMIVAAIGVVVGLVGGLALTRLMTAVLFGVSANDPLTFGAVAIVLLAVSALAAYLPARRASSVSPVQALHHD